jgi:hypothetical protein
MEIMSAAGWRIKSGVSHSLSLVFSFEGDNPSIIAAYCQQLPVARRRAM